MRLTSNNQPTLGITPKFSAMIIETRPEADQVKAVITTANQYNGHPIKDGDVYLNGNIKPHRRNDGQVANATRDARTISARASWYPTEDDWNGIAAFFQRKLPVLGLSKKERDTLTSLVPKGRLIAKTHRDGEEGYEVGYGQRRGAC